MRIRPAADNPLERIALILNLAPLPAGYALYGMTAGRVLGVAQRLGIFARLLRGPAGAETLADELGLQLTGTRLLCECLIGLGVLADHSDGFRLPARSRKWLDPASPTYVGTWIEHSHSYWEWYEGLEGVVRNGGSMEIHAHGREDQEYWRLYITGQYELARLSAGEVAKRIDLPAGASSVLDVAGGHGWFSATLCERHPGLRATVLDLPGSAAVGRRIIADAGACDRVRHVDGDMFEADLGGPHDCVLLFDIVHHLDGDELRRLLGRLRGAMRPGARLAILDMFRADGRRQSASQATLGLLFHLTSGTDLHSPGELAELLAQAGFSQPRRSRLRRIPDQALYQATAL